MISVYWPYILGTCLLVSVIFFFFGKFFWFWTVVLGKTLESPLDRKEIKSVNPKGNQLWIFIRRTDAEAESSNILVTWPEESTHWRRPWGWERLKVEGERGNRGWDGWVASLTQGTWVEQTVGDSERQGSLACYSPWVAQSQTWLSHWTRRKQKWV